MNRILIFHHTFFSYVVYETNDKIFLSTLAYMIFVLLLLFVTDVLKFKDNIFQVIYTVQRCQLL